MQVKGSSIKTVLNAVERVAGKPGLQDVLARMVPEHVKLVEGPVLPSAYFPVAVSADIHLAIRHALGKGTWDANRRVGAEAARMDFGGVYKVFLRLADYDATLDRLGGAWKQYNSAGELHWLARGKDTASCEVQGVDGFNEGQWHSIAGRVEAILLCGAKRAHATVKLPLPTGAGMVLEWVR